MTEKKISDQLAFPIYNQINHLSKQSSYVDQLCQLLETDLNFHAQKSGIAAHKLHAFPAKFPPELPAKFILSLTKPGDIVMDPMMGSGTTILEAYFNGRRSIGTDIDPLAIIICKGKVTHQNPEKILSELAQLLKKARDLLNHDQDYIDIQLRDRWDEDTRLFVDYWFALDTRRELMALIMGIEQITDSVIRNFFMISFSAMIITKSGGVSLALDLAHTRPHRAKTVYTPKGEVLFEEEMAYRRERYLSKILRSPFDEFEKRVKNNLKGLYEPTLTTYPPQLFFSDAQNLSIADNMVDLIVTSPPYASNAIDYMRAHKFSLVWMKHQLGELSQRRKDYIGGEALLEEKLELLPEMVMNVVNEIKEIDNKKGLVLHRYYSEMTRALREMYRVLKPEKAAIVVVGSSLMRNKDTLTHLCLAEIGKAIGFQVPKIGIRTLDRNRRMLPAGTEIDLNSQIQQRMHNEYVIGFYKPI